LLSQATVSAKEDGTVIVDVFKDFSGAPKEWKNIGPLTYREVNGPTHLKFIADASGVVQSFYTDDFLPVEEFQRTQGLESAGMVRLGGGVFMAVMMLALIIWVIGGIVRWHYDRSLHLTGQQFWLRLASRIGVVLFLGVIFGWLTFITVISSDESLLFGGK